MEMWLFLAAGGVFLGGVFVYLLFMVFLPEWVGITGKTAIEAEKSHLGGTSAGPELLSRIQREHTRPEETSPGESTGSDSTNKPT